MPNPGYDSYLQRALSKYRHPDATKRDVLTTVQKYRGLFPKLDSFVFNDGTQKELLNLDGTIPVSYKGNTYNIPVCIWLLDTHPHNAPMCYVKPTNDMQIKVSRHVDQNGKIYLPYLHDWKPNSSDLLGVIQVMIIVFGDQPPVYSKPRQHADHVSQAPVQPPPSASVSNINTPYPTGNQAYMPLPAMNSSTTNPAPPAPQPASHMYPQYQPGIYPPVSAYQAPNVYPSTGNYPYPGAGNTPTYTPYPQPAVASAYGPPAPYPAYPQTNVATATGTSPSLGNTITEAHIRTSLLSAVEEKLRRRLRDIYAQSQAEMDVLKKTQDDLNRGKVKLEDMINKLEQEQLDLEKNIVVLKDKNEAMSELIDKMQNQEAIDIDEAVVTVAPLYKQLLNAFAEENAIEDAIYYLGEALRKQVIDLDVFLKHVRELSRRQFMLRALVQKCREKANLPC